VSKLEKSTNTFGARNKAGLRALLLFFVTALSVFATGTVNSDNADKSMHDASFWAPFAERAALLDGCAFAVTLLTILLAHEFGHYIAARLHRVPASLPHFIPMPFLSPFGTMGAVIRMPGSIASRKALLDIGAAGPLAGLLLAIPLYAWGVAHSPVKPLVASETVTHLGNSLLLSALDTSFAPTIPEGHDVFLSPVAFAAWASLFVTMINLIPAAQLDGGHVAYALFGIRQNRFARLMHLAMLLFFLASVGVRAAGSARAGTLDASTFGQAISASLFWFAWFQMLALLSSLSAPDEGLSPRTRGSLTLAVVILAGVAQKAKSPWLWALFVALVLFVVGLESLRGSLQSRDLLEHPPTNTEPLGWPRTLIAILTLTFFVLLFMPTPMTL
jgi:membrane-associated protease RseP (regulator of RpoE activity)